MEALGRPSAGGPAAHRHVAVGGDRPGRSRTAAAGGPPGALRPRLPAGAATLARAALAAEPSAAAGLVLGESLYNLGSFEEAEAVLAAATERAAGDDEVVRVATVRRRNLFRGCRRDADAVEVGRAAASRVASTAARDELLTGEAEVLAISGSPLDALALLEQVDVTAPRLRVLAAMPRAAALAMTGRTAEAVAVERAGVRRPCGAGRRARHRLARHAIA